MSFDQTYFDAGIDRTGTDCIKWDIMRSETGDPDLLPMWVADMDFPSPPAIQEALKKVAAQGTWGYTQAPKENAEALCAYWLRRHQVTIHPEAVLVNPSVVTGLRIAVRTLTQPGDGVLITTPVYGPFFFSIEQNGRRVVESPLVQDESGRWFMNTADMERKLAAGEAKAVMLCSPHNPCGRPWRREELAQVVAICRKHQVPLICDEIHADFVFTPEGHVSILSLEEARDMTIMLCAASKTFNVAGLEHSAMICENPEIREKLQKELTALGIHASNCFSLAATRAAYTDCDAWLDGLKAYLMDNRDAAIAYFRENMPKIGVTPLEATYLMWLDCRALGLTQEELLDRVLKAHVKLNDGLFFGECGRGFLRMNIGCPRHQLMTALERLKEALQ